MAALTPIKRYQRGLVVTDVNKCVTCSAHAPRNDRYSIILDNGTTGKSLSRVESFLDITFAAVNNNFGSYICRRCNGLITRYESGKNTLENKYNSIAEKSQKLHSFISTKRSKNFTPKKSPKVHVYSGKKTFPRNDSLTPTKSVKPYTPVQSKIPTPQKSRKSLFQTGSPTDAALQTPSQSILCGLLSESSIKLEAETPVTMSTKFKVTADSTHTLRSKSLTPLEKSAEIVQQVTMSKRSRTCMVTFRNLETKAKMLPLIDSMRGGNVKQILKKVKEVDPEGYQNAIVAEFKGESELLAKEENSRVLRQNDPMSLAEMNLNEMENAVTKSAQTAWKSLCEIARKSNNKVNKRRVLTAFLLLMNCKSQFINRFQMANVITMYRHDLNKEGFHYLARMGVTVTYCTLQKKLKQAEKSEVSRKLSTLKTGMERNQEVCSKRCQVIDSISYTIETPYPTPTLSRF